MFKDENRHYSLRKLSVGLASVLIGISFVNMTGNSVKADTVESGSNSAQTVVKSGDDAVKIGAKDDASAAESNTESADEAIEKDSNAIAQDIKQKATRGDVPEAVTKNATDGSQIATKSALKGSDSLTVNNDAVKDTVEVAKQGLETPAVKHADGNETTLNVKDSKTEVKGNQALGDPAKSKLKTATLMTTTGKKFNAQMLSESKVVLPAADTNGGFDSSWGKLNVNDWQGNIRGDYYQLTSYTGDANHIIVPNEADFAKAGISISGKQVGVTSDLMRTIFRDKTTAANATVAFSKTDNKQVKAIDANWSNTWWHDQYFVKAQLSRFDGTNLDVSNVTNMSYMFSANKISDLSSLANWKVDSVTDMSYMFDNNQISDLSPLTNWNVNNVRDMSMMFEQNQISDLSSLANWKVDNVHNMSGMFEQNQISDLNPLTNWKVDNVFNMGGMFDDNATTQTKNLQAKRVISFVYPSNYAGKKQDPVTQIVDVPQKVNVKLTTNAPKPSNSILDWATKTETPEASDPVYFQDYTVPEIKGLLEPDQTVISREQADIAKPINVTVTYKLVDSNTNDAFALDPKNGLHEHANVNDNGGYDEDYWGKINVDDWNYTVNGDRIEINGLKDSASTGANDAVIVPNLDDFKLAGKDGNAKAVYISSSALGETAKHKYYGLSKTNNNIFATDSDINSAFRDDSNLTHADLNSLNTSNVINMSYMFYGASSLTSLDVSNWDTGNVTDMSWMFYGASSLTSLDVSNWDTGNVTDMSWMFYGASSLTSLDVSKWDTSRVTGMYAMFYGASSLTSLDVSNWDTGNVTNMSYMFYGASGLTSLDVSKWDTSKVTGMYAMFNGASSLTSLDVSNWDTGNVTNMSYMFYGASGLTSLDVSKWDTSKVTAMSGMFNDASGLTSLDVSKWDTSRVTGMYAMFNGAKSLTSLDVSKWDTGNVTAMSYMFDGASGLTSLDVSNWKTGNVTNMSYMFYGASSLTSLDVSNWDTGNVTNMIWMFDGASSLTSLDVSKWDTSNVTDMYAMFDGDPKLAVIVNGDKFADYLVKNNFMGSGIDSDVKSVTTDNTKLLKLLTNDVQNKSATRTIMFTFPANYSPDLAKYHLTKNGSTYQIKQSAYYAKSYAQGTVLINATGDITKHHIDTTKKNKLSDTWQPNYDKLVLAHKNSDGSVSFDAIQLPKVPGYKTVASPVNPARALFAVSFMALPKPVTPAINDTKPAKTVTPATPVTEAAELIKTEAKAATSAAKVIDSSNDAVAVTPKVIDLSNDTVVTTPKEATWQVADEPDQDTYRVSNGQYAVELPHISNAQLHVIANDSTKDSILFTYKGQNTKYVFKIKFVNGHYLLTTYEIKSGKLVKLIDCNFVESSKMIDAILGWLKLQ